MSKEVEKKMTLSSYLKKVREDYCDKHKIKRYMFPNMLGIDQSSVHHYENGAKLRTPRRDVLGKYVSKANADPYLLLTLPLKVE